MAFLFGVFWYVVFMFVADFKWFESVSTGTHRKVWTGPIVPIQHVFPVNYFRQVYMAFYIGSINARIEYVNVCYASEISNLLVCLLPHCVPRSFATGC